MPKDKIAETPSDATRGGFVQDLESIWRPHGLADVVGQTVAIAQIRSFLALNKAHGTMPGHLLITGENGMGKSAIA